MNNKISFFQYNLRKNYLLYQKQFLSTNQFKNYLNKSLLDLNSPIFAGSKRLLKKDIFFIKSHLRFK